MGLGLLLSHAAPWRSHVDWADEALMALHFALRDKTNDALRREANRNLPNPIVYVLEPERFQDQIKALPEIEITKEKWRAHVEKHPFYEDKEDQWEHAYLPGDEEDLNEVNIPRVPCSWTFRISHGGSPPSAAD